MIAVIYTEPKYHNGRSGYEFYTREVYCTCGKRLGTQTKYHGQDNFSFDYDDRDKAEYKFCPFCGKEIVLL